jgi:hypothetical protein
LTQNIAILRPHGGAAGLGFVQVMGRIFAAVSMVLLKVVSAPEVLIWEW